MKKIIISTILCFAMLVPAVAQDTDGASAVNKLLPKAGDFAIGIDAAPFLEYLGGFMGGNSFDKVPHFDGFQEDLYMKYFLTDNTAIRAKIDLTISQVKNKEGVVNDYAVSTDPTNVAATVFDTEISSTNAFGINLGYELRRGKGRIQGFYGGELYLGCGREKTRYEYGNPITESNQRPTTIMGAPVAQGYRMLENKGGTFFNFGLGGFVGVEYFFAPQLSIGGEFSLSFRYFNIGQSEFTTEGFLGNGVQEFKYRGRNYKDDDFSSELRVMPKGNIFIMFHF